MLWASMKTASASGAILLRDAAATLSDQGAEEFWGAAVQITDAADVYKVL